MRDIIKKIPKLRGYRFNSHVTKFTPVNVGALNIFTIGAAVTPKALFEQNIIRNVGGKLPKVKILGTGEITVKVTVNGCLFSKTAKDKIEKAGGTIK